MLIDDLDLINKQKENKIIDVNTFNFDENDKNYNVNFYHLKNHSTINNNLIIDFHGGAWIYGDKDTNGLFCMELAKYNYLITSFTYPLIINNFTLIDIMRSTFKAINFILNMYNRYHFNKNNITLIGDSAGGHLLLLFLAINNSKELQSIYNVNHIDININSVILNHAAPFLLDLVLLKKHKIINILAKRTFNIMMFGDNKKRNIIRNNSSLNQIIKYIDKNLKYLIITSDGDKVCKEQTTMMTSLFKKENINFNFYIEKSDDSYHVYNVLEPYLEISKKCNNYIINFINSNN